MQQGWPDPSLPSVWGPAVRFFLARVVQNWDLDSVMWCVLRLEVPRRPFRVCLLWFSATAGESDSKCHA